eukprot:Skav231549  [mRNA]  locus=scaffold84:786680:786934:+ [translate_table: standard]
MFRNAQRNSRHGCNPSECRAKATVSSFKPRFQAIVGVHIQTADITSRWPACDISLSKLLPCPNCLIRSILITCCYDHITEPSLI